MAPVDDEVPRAAQVRAEVDHWLGRAREILHLEPKKLPAPDVVFDLVGCAAGQAVLATRPRRQVDKIRFNAGLLASHPMSMLRETVPHEVAHVAVHRRYGRRVKPHGPAWRELMQSFGVPARACHRLPVEPSRRMQRFAYRCGCAETAWLTTIRHNRVARGQRYLCRRCGVELQRETAAE
ncbi:SprT family zinc-dependent metalloprotease [Salinisphaera orenii]|uniref:SprT family zinc-dependent metalloprotease n=1 Tax=Salinisphaera orenii TaxID=856731 RepID=UPI0013A66D6F